MGVVLRPPRWHDDLLKATEYFALRGGTPDPRLAGAVDLRRTPCDELSSAVTVRPERGGATDSLRMRGGLAWQVRRG